MVSLFSRLYGGRSGHRRSRSSTDVREPSQQSAQAITSADVSSTNSQGIEDSVDFRPVEHPTEPHDHDQPVRCPLPEPSVINDGRIWKERVSASARARADLSVVMESVDLALETTGSRTRYGPAKQVILPSHSAPEHNLVNILEECNTS